MPSCTNGKLWQTVDKRPATGLKTLRRQLSLPCFHRWSGAQEKPPPGCFRNSKFWGNEKLKVSKISHLGKCHHCSSTTKACCPSETQVNMREAFKNVIISVLALRRLSWFWTHFHERPDWQLTTGWDVQTWEESTPKCPRAPSHCRLLSGPSQASYLSMVIQGVFFNWYPP